MRKQNSNKPSIKLTKSIKAGFIEIHKIGKGEIILKSLDQVLKEVEQK